MMPAPDPFPLWRLAHGDGDGNGEWILDRAGTASCNALHHQPREAEEDDMDCIWSSPFQLYLRSAITKAFSENVNNIGLNKTRNCDNDIVQPLENTEENDIQMHFLESEYSKSIHKDTLSHVMLKVDVTNYIADKHHDDIVTPKDVEILGIAAVAKKDNLDPRKHCNNGDSCQPLFKTGLGKPVHVSSSAMARAKSVLGLNDKELSVLNGGTFSEKDFQVASVLEMEQGVKKFQDDAHISLREELFSVAKKEFCKYASSVVDPDMKCQRGQDMSETGAGYLTSKSSNLAMNDAKNAGENAHVYPVEHTAACAKGVREIKPKHVKCNLDNEGKNASSRKTRILQDLSVGNELLFQTAAGKRVSISNVALEKAAKLFRDENDYNTKRAGKLPLANEIATEGNKYGTDMKFGQMQSSLFQTAGGKSLSVPSAAMERAANLFNENLSSDNGSLELMHREGKNKFLFQTATGQSISISNTSMKRAMTLLGESNIDGPDFTSTFEEKFGRCFHSRGLNSRFMSLNGASVQDKDSTLQKLPIKRSGTSRSATKSDTFGGKCMRDPPFVDVSNKRYLSFIEDPAIKTFQKKSRPEHSAIEISNYPSNIKKRQCVVKPVLAFKKPRCSLFPMAVNTGSGQTEDQRQPPGAAQSEKQEIPRLHLMHHKHPGRMNLELFFKLPPHNDRDMALDLPGEVLVMTADTAKDYKFKVPVSPQQGDETIGSNELRLMLLEAGANPQHATTDWVENHYKWIIWKLACLERSYPRQVSGKLLTIKRLLDELKYRYEREINCGHRSAIRKIVEGDAPAGWMMILCVSAIRGLNNDHPDDVSRSEEMKEFKQDRYFLQRDKDITAQAAKSHQSVIIELTDGWYALDAVLDLPLVKQLYTGKIFVGQKLRICGASLFGCIGSMPPSGTQKGAKLSLHINGTFRVHWAERLGFCKDQPLPLSFSCIKDNGGIVPRTIIGVIRVYPLLYYERLGNGCSITRSRRAEDIALSHFNYRRERVAEEILMKLEKDFSSFCAVVQDMDEGARLHRILENTAEPELLMAGMTPAQLVAISAYQVKREVARQTSIEEAIKNALKDAKLDSRDVTPILKVRVRGLLLKYRENLASVDDNAFGKQRSKRFTREGLITLWQPTEKQIHDIQEGSIHCVSGLTAVVGSHNSRSLDLIQLRATRSSKWEPLPQRLLQRFEFAYPPRTAFQISALGSIALCSEFDVAVMVVHIGQPYPQGLYRKQWIFVSDGSLESSSINSSPTFTSLLAIQFSATTSDAFLPMDTSLTNCVIGFCNLIKRNRDHRNELWVAEASDTAFYSANLKLPSFSHLKQAAESVTKWATSSRKVVQSLKNRIADILGTAFVTVLKDCQGLRTLQSLVTPSIEVLIVSCHGQLIRYMDERIP